MTAVRVWTGREASALRAALRLSIRDFAELLGVGVRTVTKWQARGEDVCLRPTMQALLDTALTRSGDEVRARFELILGAEHDPASSTDHSPALAVPPSLLADQWDHRKADALAEFLTDERELTPGTALTLSQEWRVVDPPQLVETRAGRRIGTRLAEVVVERTDALRRMDDFLGGGDMHDLVRRELRVTLAMVRGASYTEKTGRLLLGAVGELCQLAGWVASDAGLYDLAARYYLGGVSAAHAADDKPLAANLLSSLAYQVANVGDRPDAVLLACTAYHGAEKTATPTARALLLERLAWANARFGDTQATIRTLAQVDETFADSQPDNDPVWVYWLNQDEIDVMAGRCLTELKQPKKAIALLDQAVRRYDDSHAREKALYLSWLAEAHADNGNAEEAAATALRALHLSASTTSARSTDRIKVVRRALQSYRGNSAVDEFEDQAAAVLDLSDRGSGLGS
ncbi:tetratricopeptide repeat protein [Planosporangium thailandense]|uniref:Tetratricopeptide repeat protein n=1 Tax=Planosporangium thailandense TaxID=765197 RepID=A0ABX0Y224_9ACTN|nr:tetratricopeptide repeat protein [Planosporangium thailandense]NJC71484.1 tetratricopeptide repeat protein [Planosporangium thailandense]